MKRCTSIILAFVAGAVTVRNVSESLLRGGGGFASPFLDSSSPWSAPANDATTTSVMMMDSLEQRFDQMTQDVARMNASIYETASWQRQQQQQPEPPRQRNHQLDEQQQQSQPEKLGLPQCDEFMQRPNSRFADGAFLTSISTPIAWTLRADGSRQVDLNNYHCRLKRYTAMEAKTCLASQHVTFIGDSLTRYQYLSLAYFLEHEAFPPRFGNFRQPCSHLDEHGRASCSSLDEPNICMETDWRQRIPKEFGDKDQWMYFFASLGGYSASQTNNGGGIMNGRMECSCARGAAQTCGSACGTENQLYTTRGQRPTVVSYFKEDGWADAPNPLHGFYFTNCSATGTCRQTFAENQQRVNRSIHMDFDWSQPFPQAINASGVLRQAHGILPSQPNVVLYNRGHWGKLSKERSKTIMPVLYDWVHQQADSSVGTDSSSSSSHSHSNARCFFKSTTASSGSMRENHAERELREVRLHEAGCSYLDYAYLTQPFAAMPETKDWREHGERGAVFWDAVHYMPWVYEELNQVLLNVLCNTQKLSTTTATTVQS
jgi:hypothetical protein